MSHIGRIGLSLTTAGSDPLKPSANKVGNLYIFDSGDVVSALGATVVGILGSIYGHWSPGDALPSMMPGILILLPAGLSVVGGLSANFHSPSSSVISWLTTGLSMVQGKSSNLALNVYRLLTDTGKKWK